jgi:phage terminase large subunit-like protein
VAGGLLDTYSPEAIRQALARANPEQAAFLEQALKGEVEARLFAWRCKLPECDGLPHDGMNYRHARSNQNPPPGEWAWWYIKAGRGFGKTRAGAEWIKDRLLDHPGCRTALVARTFSDGRDVMVEGESGLLSVLPASVLKGGTRDRAWNRSIGELTLANGSLSRIYSSEKPASLRGPQHHFAWGDEPAYWLDAHKGELEDTTWSNLNLGLRLGRDATGILTSTPARVKLLTGTKERPGILNQPDVIVTEGSTFDNLANLAPTFRSRILARYEGTRIGRQELYAELLTDVEGALWTMEQIDNGRVDTIGAELDVIAVAVDPNVTDGAEADECGIVIGGRVAVCPVCGPDERGPHAFVIRDASAAVGPSHWPALVVKVYDEEGADRATAEVNNGGDLVINAIKAVDARIPVTKVVASRGKRVRAEPVATLYEQGRVHHVGAFPELEEQMTGWVPNAGDSPDRMDALVWLLTDLMLGKPERRLRFEP